MTSNKLIFTYKSNGKLLITSEYFVLDGAKALALPTQLGQKIAVETNINQHLVWKNYTKDGYCWFEGVFDTQGNCLSSTQKNVAEPIEQILKYIIKKDKTIDFSYKIITQTLEFDQNWGLGSSATFINNISKWLNINPYELSDVSFGGSGYDIACASAQKAIIFERKNNIPTSYEIDFQANFLDDLYLIPLGYKKNSREGIQYYREKVRSTNQNDIIKTLHTITHKIISCNALDEFEDLLLYHETIIAKNLKLKRLQEEYFNDYQGVIKSLGAWGGDFILVTKRPQMEEYFIKKGLKTIIPYKKLILTPNS